MNHPEHHNSVLEVIYERRSVRSYSPQQVEHGTIHALLDAAIHAPTAIHGEPWAFIVVQDKSLLRSLSDRSKKTFIEETRRIKHERGEYAIEAFQDPEFNFFFNAGTLIVICGKSMGLYVAADCWLAAENLILTACSMELGTCIISSVTSTLNSPEIKTEFDIPAGFSAVVPIIVGVPDEESLRTPRNEPRIFSWK